VSHVKLKDKKTTITPHQTEHETKQRKITSANF